MARRDSVVAAGAACRPLWSRHKVNILYDQFMALTNQGIRMSRPIFVTNMLDKGVCQDSLLASCLFAKFASSSNSISFAEYTLASTIWTGGSEDERLQMQFALWDKHNAGCLDKTALEMALFYGMTDAATSVVSALLQKVRERGTGVDRREFVNAARGKGLFPSGSTKWYFGTITSRFAGRGASAENEQAFARTLNAAGGWTWIERSQLEGDAALAARLHKDLNGVSLQQKEVQPLTMVLRVPSGLIDLGSPKNYKLVHVSSGTEIRGGVQSQQAKVELPGSILTEPAPADEDELSEAVEARRPDGEPDASADERMSSTRPRSRSRRRRGGRKLRSIFACFTADTVQQPQDQPAPASRALETWMTAEESAAALALASTSTPSPQVEAAEAAEEEQAVDFTDSTTCPVCFDRKVDTVLAPCSHWFCHECASKLLGANCAMCRGDARAVLKAEFTEQRAL